MANLALEKDQNRDQVVIEQDEALAAPRPPSLSRRQTSTFGTSMRQSLGSLAHRVQDFALRSIRYLISGRVGRPSATGAPAPPAAAASPENVTPSQPSPPPPSLPPPSQPSILQQVKQEDAISHPEQPQQAQKVKIEPEDQAPSASSPRIKAIKVEEAVTPPGHAMPAAENAQPARIMFAIESNPVNPLGFPMPSTDLVAAVLQAPPDPFSEPLLNFPSPQPTPLTDLLSAPRLYEPDEDLPQFVATGLPTSPESPDRMKRIFINGY